jgi:low affinity Fe/Cu permease
MDVSQLFSTILNMGGAAAPFAVYLLIQNNRLQSRLDKALDDRLTEVKELNEVVAKFTDALKELSSKIIARS